MCLMNFTHIPMIVYISIRILKRKIGNMLITWEFVLKFEPLLRGVCTRPQVFGGRGLV